MDPGFDISPEVEALQDGSVLVVWHSYRTGQSQLFLRRYTSGIWQEEVQLTNDPYTNLKPALAQTRVGVLWLVWASNATGNFDLHSRTSSDNGVTWSPSSLRLTEDSGTDLNPSIDELQDGRLVLFWDSNRNGSEDLYYRIYDGTIWGPETRLTIHPDIDWQPDTLQTSDGSLWVFWATNRRGNQEVFFQRGAVATSSITWGQEVRLTQNVDTDHLPSALQDVNGTLWLVWSSDRGSVTADEDVFYKTSPDLGLTWSDDTRLVSDLASDADPAITQSRDPAGSLWVVFHSTRTENVDIYYKTNPVLPVHDASIFGAAPARSFVYQGFKIDIGIAVQNDGNLDETFQVRAYANGSLIGTRSVMLAPGQLTIVTIPWNSTGAVLFTNYFITVEVPPLAGEANTANNYAVAGSIYVRLVGDVDNDRRVTVDDVLQVIVAWGSRPGMSNWNPFADIDGDNQITLDDVLLVTTNWGRTG